MNLALDPALVAAEENGAAAALAGVPMSLNPYLVLTDAWRAWERGYVRERIRMLGVADAA